MPNAWLSDSLSNALRPWPFRGKYRLLDALTPRTGRRSARIFNSAMELDLADSIQRQIYLGAYEPHETEMVRSWLRPGMTFVDAGANVGYFTALAAACVGPAGRVFAIEPQPYAHERLARMIENNALGQTRALWGGLSDRPGELPLYLPSESSGQHNATMVAHANDLRIAVPVKTLDGYLEEWGVERVDLLKVDVEGHEPRVFEGASRALAEGRIRAVLCEFNDFWLRQAGTSARALYETLIGAGFADRDGPARFVAGDMQTRFLRYAAQ